MNIRNLLKLTPRQRAAGGSNKPPVVVAKGVADPTKATPGVGMGVPQSVRSQRATTKRRYR